MDDSEGVISGLSACDQEVLYDAGVPSFLALEWERLFPGDPAEKIACFYKLHGPLSLAWREAVSSAAESAEWAALTVGGSPLCPEQAGALLRAGLFPVHVRDWAAREPELPVVGMLNYILGPLDKPGAWLYK